MSKADTHKWEFKARFRRHAFGWKSQPAIQRVKQAVAEIKKIARKDAVLAGEGAVLFLERVSPAIEQVDSSSGAIGTAVNNAVRDLVTIIAEAPVDAAARDQWLERLWEAHENDKIPYIESLADHWGELCASSQVASRWADRLLGITRMVLGPERKPGDHFHGTAACLSALHGAGRHAELIDLLEHTEFWHYKRWAAKALGALGRIDEAIALAEASRGSWTSDGDVNEICEGLLLGAGRVEEAYSKYAIGASGGGTYLATFRAIAKKYPDKEPERVLDDLVRASPGTEGKWFATAKELGLMDAAIKLARRSPCDPKTLTRAARDHLADNPVFAVEAGYLALMWIDQGAGYEITGADVWSAYFAAMKGAEALGRTAELKVRLKELVRGAPDSFVARILGRELAQ